MSLLVWIVVLVALVLLILYLRVWRKAPEYAVLPPAPKPLGPMGPPQRATPDPPADPPAAPPEPPPQDEAGA